MSRNHYEEQVDELVYPARLQPKVKRLLAVKLHQISETFNREYHELARHAHESYETVPLTALPEELQVKVAEARRARSESTELADELKALGVHDTGRIQTAR